MKTIKQTYQIKAPVERVWQALIDPILIGGWGGGPAKMNGRLGAKFTLWGGDIHGTNIEVVPHKKLVQEWFGGNWDAASRLEFRIKAKGESTEVKLIHESVPDNAAKDIEEGWKDYYMGPLKEFVEHGN